MGLVVTENATQTGSKAAAVMNEVDAVLRRIGRAVLLSNDLAEISARWPEIAVSFQSQKRHMRSRVAPRYQPNTSAKSDDAASVPPKSLGISARRNRASAIANVMKPSPRCFASSRFAL